MSEARKTAATRFLDAEPRLREAMRRSAALPELERARRIEDEGRVHYLVRGDTLGGLDDLYLDALVRGASPHADPRERALFEELDEDLKSLVAGRGRPR